MFNYGENIVFACLVIVLCFSSCLSIPNFQEYGDYNRDVIHKVVKRQVKSSTCKDFQYQCKTKECLDESVVCDGIKDCKDGSDETEEVCSVIRCPAYNFRCDYGACVDLTAKCNGKSDCADGSDESKFKCATVIPPNITNHCKDIQYKCKSGTCISENLLCNGIKDCDDGSDESLAQCEHITCPKLTFRCDYGACMDAKVKCNGNKECPDGSDESPKICKPGSGTTKPTPTKPKPVTPNPAGTCEIPIAADKSYALYDENGNKLNVVAGGGAPKYSKLVATCNKGYLLEERKKTFDSICYNKGLWEPPLKTCMKTCPPLVPNGVDLSCYHNGTEVDCKTEVLAGTQARPTCKPLYQPKSDPFYHFLNCQADGQWDQLLYSCVPVCGLQSSVGLIANGVNAIFGDSPWHVAIYKISSNFLLICGGTLVHSSIVISAAHCFYDEAEDTPLNKTSDYEIVVSKITRTYSVTDKSTQDKRQVKKLIYSDKGYSPKKTNHYGSDIIIIVLAKPVIISQFVLPACLATTERQGFNPGEKTPGKLVGWGLDAHESLTEVLQAAEQPYISYNECIKKEPHVSNDKFCAGSDSGPGARTGDSGGGLLFRNPNNGLYYLRGIVSTKGRYSNTSIATYTDISYYMEWIVQERNKVEADIIRGDTTLGQKT